MSKLIHPLKRTIAGVRGILLAFGCFAGCAGLAQADGAGVEVATESMVFYPSTLPQLRLSRTEGQVMVTLLRDDLLHIAYHPRLSPGKPFLSPMVVKRDYTGPTSYAWDAKAARLSTADLIVEVEQGCLRVSERTAVPARVLSRLCVAEWAANRLRLALSPEGNTEILGLGQLLSAARDSPSWLGSRRETGDYYGNKMTYSSIAASGNTQVPVAYVLGEGLRNYGLFFDTPYALQFDFSGSDWKVDSGRDSLGLFIFAGPDLKNLRKDYLELTGRPPVPPLKAFGLWLSEYGYDNWSELDGKLTTLRTGGFPIDGAVLDLQWYGGIKSGSQHTAMGGLRWDPTAFPNPREKIARYAAHGLGLMLIEQSYIGGALPEFADLAKRRLMAMDCAPPCTDAVVLDSNPWWGIGGMIDWSHPEVGGWWHDSKRAPLIDDGVLGHWIDLGEPEMYRDTAHYYGIDWHGERSNAHRDIHNLYNFFWSRSIAEETARTHPERRPWMLSRSGTAGSQRFGVAMWSGDIASSFAALNAQMAAQTNMSLSGFDYYGSDIGGFQRRSVTKDYLDKLYTRWLVTGSLLEIPLRPHVQNLCNCTETAPDRVGDAASNRAALKLRYRLTPYLYSLAHQAYRDAEPIFPPLSYHFQADPQARAVASTKMIGPWLLFGALNVADEHVDIYLPKGKWVDFYRPEQRISAAGGFSSQAVTDAGLVRAPMFLREGAIVPMLRQAPPHLGSANAKGVYWFCDLLIRTVPGRDESRFVLYEDDGISRAYERGNVARTTIVAHQPRPGSYRIALRPDNRTGSSARRKVTLEILTGPTTILHASVNGQSLPRIEPGAEAAGWYPSRGGVTIHLPPRSVDEAVEILLTSLKG